MGTKSTPGADGTPSRARRRPGRGADPRAPSRMIPSAPMYTDPTTTTHVATQPCLDLRCPIHAHGADLARTQRLTCARQVLRAYGRPDLIPLLDHGHPLPSEGAQRVVWRLQSSPIAAGQSGRIVPQQTSPGRRIHHFRAERIILQEGECWRIDDILMGGKSQIAPHEKLPAALFGSQVLGASLLFDRIARPLDMEFAVTRLGNAGTGLLIGGILGSATYEPRILPMCSDVRTPPGTSVQIGGDCAQPIEVHRLVIDDGADWLIHDIEVNDRSAFAQPGNIPGDLFSPEVLDNFLRFGTLRVGARVRIHASYLGDDPEGRPFRGEFRGQEPEVATADLESSAGVGD